MRGRGLIWALLFVVGVVVSAWLTGDNSPLDKDDAAEAADSADSARE